ncbi:MAG: Melibiase [bacterium ADurb.Bin236]|nr:MAG: Melibiase [bacterium ADurb.Bin236]HOY62029.1 alpha-galactosidase [bacterium]
METMKNRAAGVAAAIILSLFVSSGAGAAPVVRKDNRLFAMGAQLAVIYNMETGTFDIARTNGEAVARGARAEVVVTAGGKESTLSTRGAAKLGWFFEDIEDAHGKGASVSVTATGSGSDPDVVHTFRVYDNQPFILMSVTAQNVSDKPIGVRRLSPIVVDSGDGESGVFLGLDPADVVALENGHRLEFDFWVRRTRAADGSDSNWSVALYDEKSGRALVAGFLSQREAFGSVSTGSGAVEPALDARTGRRGLGLFHARSAFTPTHRVAPYTALESDAFFIMGAWDAPLGALDVFARASAQENSVPSSLLRPVPTFWDTWYSKYSTGINEQIILDNLDAATEKLAPFGLNAFHIDAGWEKRRGDWEPNEKFPGGMKALADAIRARGLTPSIWIAPFSAAADSPVCVDNPGWFLDPDAIGSAIIPSNERALDISNPEALAWLSGVISRVVHDWGFGIIKVDFTYYSLLGRNYAAKGRTRAEIFRDAFKAMRAAAGPDAYILAVGVPVGIHAGLVDGMRTGLDTAPRIGEERGYAAQGFKPAFSSMIRRQFLNNILWHNDPDVIYTGSEETAKRWGENPLPKDALAAWASAVALSGQILEIADPPADMTPDALAIARAVLPVFPKGARPLDLFTKNFPEILSLRLDAPDSPRHIVGIFNWGENDDNGATIPAEARLVHLPFSALGLSPNAQCHVFDFWKNEYVGNPKFGHAVRLAPHSVQVVSVVEALDRPQFIATNRHITMGATDVRSVSWDQASLELRGSQDSVAGFDYALTFHAPEPYQFDVAEVAGSSAAAELSPEGRVITVRFTPAESGNANWTLKFKKPGPPAPDAHKKKK